MAMREDYGQNLEQTIGYQVVDVNDETIGTVSAVWEDETGEPAFVGIKTGWLMGKTHVAPAWDAQVNHGAQRVRVPYTQSDIKSAPSYDPDVELTDAEQREVMAGYEGRSLSGRPPGARESMMKGGRTAAGTEEVNIPLHEEELKVGKRSFEAGGVRLRKVVRTETVQQPVELKHEDIVIERTAPRGRAPSGEAFKGEEVYIPWRREEPVVEKQTRVREEVRARKTADVERETVQRQVRKEDIKVDEEKRRPEHRI